ncbi:MAG: hypothetical protein QXJ76_08270, partial [Candidatus Bathyarchaeia archaeon]
MRKTLLLEALALLLLFSSAYKINPASTIEAHITVVPDDYPTIQEAAAHAVDSDTMLFKAGTYLVDENSAILIDKTLSLLGED